MAEVFALPELKSFVDSRYLPEPRLSSGLPNCEMETILVRAVVDPPPSVKAAWEDWVVAAPQGLRLEPQYSSQAQSHTLHQGQLVSSPDLSYRRLPAGRLLKTKVLHPFVEYNHRAPERGGMGVPMPKISIHERFFEPPGL